MFAGLAACSAPQQAAPAAPPPPLQYLGAWGTAGAGPGQLLDPRDLGTDSLGNVFVADLRKHVEIEKFGVNGQPRLAFSTGGRENPWDIAVDPGNAIFLLDLGHEAVHIYSPEGLRIRILSLRYRRYFKYPASLAIDAEGNFYVADFGTGRIVQMNPRGRIVRLWGKPQGLAVKKWMPARIRLGPDENFYVADMATGRLERISREGRFTKAWDFSFSGLEPGRRGRRLCGLAVSQNFLAASDAGKRLLKIWALGGTSETTADFSEHPEWGQHAEPTDIAFSTNGELLVLDRPDGRVLRFRINLSPAGPRVPDR